MEMVQSVPLARTITDPLIEHSHSATTQLTPALPVAQSSPSPIFNQEIRERTFSMLPDIRLSATPVVSFSEETIASTLPATLPSISRFVFSQEAQGGTLSTLATTQPITASMSVLRQEIQDRTISALQAGKSSTAPMVVSGQEQLIKDITISL